MPSPQVGTSASPTSAQSASALAAAVEAFFKAHEDAAVLEEGKLLFEIRSAKFRVSADGARCTLHLWSDERNTVRRILSATERNGTLRLSTQRFGQAQPRLLELVAGSERRTPSSREAARTRYLQRLGRVIEREFAPWKPDGFRAAMDLERSFGPAYVRGSLLRGREAWAVIGVGAHETPATIDGVLTLGILWLHSCRERAGGRRLYGGLKVIVPAGMATLTLSRLAWMNNSAGKWELFEFNEGSEELVERDPADQGNLRTRLIHRPGEAHARERFAAAVATVRELVPQGEWERVEQRLRSPTELAFLLHGLQFARARVVPDERSFRQAMEITVGAGAGERLLSTATAVAAAGHIAELFARRRVHPIEPDFGARGLPSGVTATARRIGSGVLRSAHGRTLPQARVDANRLAPAQDPLYRAAPERWLESVLRADLAPLTRNLALAPPVSPRSSAHPQPASDDPDTRGNHADSPLPLVSPASSSMGSGEPASRIIPRLTPGHVYTQVPAIAGASDRGLLDLLGITEDGRLAVIELKTEDDLHFALQGLDYWIRVRHHHLQSGDLRSGLGEFQRHGYFTGLQLSPLPPRLYLVAPALHIHPATETLLQYLAPEVEWHLLALDERWRYAVRVLWRKSSKRES